jgi:putative ABC transport system permease protein
MRRTAALCAEAIRIARSQPIASAVTAAIVAAACGVIVATTGQTVAIERDVLRRIDSAGTRTIVVEDIDGGAELAPGAVRRIEAVAGVEWAVGFGPARDVHVAGLEGAQSVPIRGYFGTLPPLITTSGGPHGRGTALVGSSAIADLGLATAAGSVDPVADNRPRIGVVGWLQAEPPLDFLNRALLTVATDDESVVRIVVLVRSAEDVPQVEAAIRAVLDPADPASVAIRTSEALVQVRAAVQGELGTWGRNLIALVLGAGLVLTGLNVFGVVTTRRRDFGRRRALGASRLDIILLIGLQTIMTAALGAAFGVLAGSLIVQQVLGTAPAPDFSVAIAVLAVTATAVAALPPALIAALRDPVRILRVA